MTAARMAREALEGKRGWFDAVREEVEAALLSSAECQGLALCLASGGEDFKGAEEGLRAAVLSGAGAALAQLVSEADDRRESVVCGDCGGAMRRRSRRSVELLTLFGLATVERWHWTCAGCGARLCPLDGGLRVETGGERLTPAMRAGEVAPPLRGDPPFAERARPRLPRLHRPMQDAPDRGLAQRVLRPPLGHVCTRVAFPAHCRPG